MSKKLEYFYGNKNIKGQQSSSGVVYDSTTDIVFRSASVSGNIVQSSGVANLSSISTTSLSCSGTVSGSTVSGALTTATQPNITSVGTLTSLTASGAVTGSTLSGALTTASQGNITSVGTLSGLSVSGNVVQSGSATANLKSINATSLSCSGAVSGSTLSGALTTATQGNITSVGTLSSLTVSGTLTVDSLEIHPVSGASSSFTNVSTNDLTWPSGRRVLSVIILNLTSSTMPMLWMYGSSNNGNQTWSGYTNGNAGGAQLTWGSACSLYNTTWSSSYNLNVNIDVIQISTGTYIIRGHGARNDGSTGYYVHYYGTVEFINSATFSKVYLSGSSMSCDSITYASHN